MRTKLSGNSACATPIVALLAMMLAGCDPPLPPPQLPATGTATAATEHGKPATAAAPRVTQSAGNTKASPPGRTRSPRGFATYYAKALDGRRTASGIPFDNDDMVAAHPTYPFGTRVRVTNLRNGRDAIVRIVDRGPSRRPRASGVIIDLSRAAAEELGFIRTGRTRVRLDVVEFPLPSPSE
jgi:rare lipoprotein A